jgi:hypothetical protein
MRALFVPSATTICFGPVSFLKPMAKAPTVTGYNYSTGAANSIRDSVNTDHASVVVNNIGETGFSSVSFATATTGAMAMFMHYTADTSW